MQLLRKGMLVARCLDWHSKKRYVGRVSCVDKRNNVAFVDWFCTDQLSHYQVYNRVINDRLVYLLCKAIGFWHYKMIK